MGLGMVIGVFRDVRVVPILSGNGFRTTTFCIRIDRNNLVYELDNCFCMDTIRRGGRVVWANRRAYTRQVARGSRPEI